MVAHPSQADTLEISLLTGEFADSDAESAFLRHRQPRTRQLLRFTLVFGAIVYFVFWFADFAALGYGKDAMILLGVRTTVAVVGLACAWLTYRPLSVRATRLAACVPEVVGMAGYMLVGVYRPADFHWHASGLIVLLMAFYLYVPNRLGYSATVALLGSGTFVLLAHTAGHMAAGDIVTMSTLLLLANICGAAGAQRFQRASREEFRAQSILEHAAIRDHLTGCFNRRYLHEHLLSSEAARAVRFGRSVTAILCDLDHFKKINDTHGHAGGDAVLLAFSGLLQRMTREQDSVVRYGGEEFLLILPETDLNGGVLLAERLRSAFETSSVPSWDGRASISTTASFGVASVSFKGNNGNVALADLISVADQLLYDAKRKGRNRVESLELGSSAWPKGAPEAAASAPASSSSRKRPARLS